MNKSLYFLIPAILIVIGLISYSTLGKTNSEALPIAETHKEHIEGDNHMSSIAASAHVDSGETSHAHE